MDVAVVTGIIVPAAGGLGIFLLGLELTERGIQALSAHRMRALLGRVTGTPTKGVLAIGVILGAIIGATLDNGPIALPLIPIGLLVAGILATVCVGARSDRGRNSALAGTGFALIVVGLDLLTSGLQPLRTFPAVTEIVADLDATTVIGVVSCALAAALLTALVRSSSATMGIVLGLGAAGVIDWPTAVASAIGADLGTTVTAWTASLTRAKDAKRAAYAQIGSTLIGVAVMLILFFPAISALTWVMRFVGGDPGVPVLVDGSETFPLVPVAVALFSVFFTVVDVLILVPLVSRVAGQGVSEVHDLDLDLDRQAGMPGDGAAGRTCQNLRRL